MRIPFAFRIAGMFMLVFLVGASMTWGRAWLRATPTEADGQVTTLATDPNTTDSDWDGCSDAEELGPDPTSGGQRDPNNMWDYFNPSRDGQNRVDDILKVVQQYFVDAGNPGYNPDTDRTTIGPNTWNLGPPNGMQRVDDILMIVKQYFHDCHGVPAPTVEGVCAELQTEAQTAGFTDPSLFSCSGDPLPQNVGVSGDQMKKRQVQVTIAPDKTAIVTGIDLEMVASPGTSGIVQPAEIPTAPSVGVAGTVTVPPACLTEVCHATLTNRAEIRHLRGHGPNCAWMSYKQEYDVYYPWHVIANVRNPVVQSGSSFPCSEEDRTSDIDRSNIPISAESWVDIKWVAGIPTPWGTIGLRTFHPEILAWFDGWYNVDWS